MSYLAIKCHTWLQNSIPSRGQAAPGIKQKAISVWFTPTNYVDCESERWQQKNIIPRYKMSYMGTKSHTWVKISHLATKYHIWVQTTCPGRQQHSRVQNFKHTWSLLNK
jgi:hypothetical protein